MNILAHKPFVLTNATLPVGVRRDAVNAIDNGLSLLPRQLNRRLSLFNVVVSHTASRTAASTSMTFGAMGRRFTLDGVRGCAYEGTRELILNARVLELARIGHTPKGKVDLIYTLFHEAGHAVMNLGWHYRVTLPCFHQFRRQYATSRKMKFWDIRYMVHSGGPIRQREDTWESCRRINRDTFSVVSRKLHYPPAMPEYLAEIFACAWLLEYATKNRALKSMPQLVAMRRNLSKEIARVSQRINKSWNEKSKRGSRSGMLLPC